MTGMYQYWQKLSTAVLDDLLYDKHIKVPVLMG